MAILGHVADDPDELARRLERIEGLLRRSPSSPSVVPPGPEVRSARSIVSRIDDVWVAVTEGNERVAAAIDQLRTGAGVAAGVAGADGGDGSPPTPDRARGGHEPGPPGPQAMTRLEDSVLQVGTRLDAIDQALAALTRPGTATIGEVADRLGRIEEALAARGGGEDVGPAVHLRLNRIEEALAGIAGRLGETAAAGYDGPGPTTGFERLEVEIGRLGQRIESLATALEASAARSADGTLTDRLGRLRDQFRR